jgi:hypothetical protein
MPKIVDVSMELRAAVSTWPDIIGNRDTCT